ncbi:septin 5a isoform X3 [Syngnathoides biaculeatus]|uniref:septin 5a isoform X3 n=1 Tax=Syngnathoides biaculeatus TaxID=300417 RepID=UPI002ADDB4AB|nr:septin 5a isoform X3 [Syngnathoides biaculeatus]
MISKSFICTVFQNRTTKWSIWHTFIFLGDCLGITQLTKGKTLHNSHRGRCNLILQLRESQKRLRWLGIKPSSTTREAVMLTAILAKYTVCPFRVSNLGGGSHLICVPESFFHHSTLCWPILNRKLSQALTCLAESPRNHVALLHSLTSPDAKVNDEEKQYVGFATLPNQVHRKSVKKGFDFTLMVAGESGMGKSTLVNSLFLTDLYKDRKLLNAEERINQTVEIIKHTVDIEEKGVKLKLTIVDTPGFGDAVNNNECWKPITDYIDQQFEQYFRDESGLNRKNIQDNRVHCCLYFIPPFGHGLRPVDVEFMKALHEKVNIIPLIAKADCLTPTEIKKLKDRIREEIDKFGIKVYQFPECDSDEDEEFKQLDKELKKQNN